MERLRDRKTGRPSAIDTEEKKKKLVELYNSGMKINDIAREMGVSSSTVTRFIRNIRKLA